MTVTALETGTIFGGIDTHADTIHVAAIEAWGRQLGDQELPTTPTGYRNALAFLTGHGAVTGIGIEGTRSYGTGIARTAVDAGFDVREVVRPERSVRRRQVKSDPIDAYQAAHAVLSGRATAAAKTADIAALRALHNAAHDRDGTNAQPPAHQGLRSTPAGRNRSTPEIMRILKRAIARKMYKQLTKPHDDLHVHDLRPTRQAENVTLEAAARALGLATVTISRTERGQFITPEVVQRYREWLETA
ncbi:hypothetical protein ASG76_09325 [Nocardioides sp. Soil774]|uniref:IS110 family transposase n=1 Tax=Nocardioides sp. Soil774 TaxID=1736408 RepID=UPI0006F3561C|nr:IS110 family transposase [Nocardioides sp. Soil774]KRE94609.1 hypothetical protein ASG76_09325 [Nocardioides sp. Soil774]